VSQLSAKRLLVKRLLVKRLLEGATRFHHWRFEDCEKGGGGGAQAL